MNRTASTIRYQKAKMQCAHDRLECCPQQQAESIARHYVAHAMMARQILHLLSIQEELRSTETNQVIDMLVNRIKENHANDFGIELTWPQKQQECQRIGGCLHDIGHKSCCCDDNSCD